MNPFDPKLIERYRQQALEFAGRAQPAAPHSNVTDDTYAVFLKTHPGRGKLRVQVSTGRGSFPVEDAAVEVSRKFGEEKRIFYKMMSDESGIVDNMELPALPSDYSQSSSTAFESGTEYQVAVFHPAYSPEQIHTVTMYDQIETLLPVSLEPNGQ